MNAAEAYSAAAYNPAEICSYGDCDLRPDYWVESYSFDFRGCFARFEPDAECPTICRAHRDDYAGRHDKLTIHFTTEPHVCVRGVRFLPLNLGPVQHIFRKIDW